MERYKIDKKVKSLFIELFPTIEESKNVKLKTDLLKLGISSIGFLKIVIAMENEFDIEFNKEMLTYENFKCLESFASYIHSELES